MRADVVIGAPNSSKSLRLAEVAEREGVEAGPHPARVRHRLGWVGHAAPIGLTAGASAPEVLVREVVDALCERFRRHRAEVDHIPSG
jgi:4-hydroxy-3-methylbut-2-enyl diphosphate reductase